MNERIRELALQAGMTYDKFGMYFAKDNHNEDGVDLEKYTELIVRECMEQIDDGNSDHAGGNREAIDRIKEHFGVDK